MKCMTESRNRITITLRGSILKKIDKYIDGDRIRNRSHAIEYILNKFFAPRITKALILAGGEGIKMRPLTYEMPKALIPIHGRPVLEYIIENLRYHNIRDIVISTGHLGSKIKEYFGNGSKFGVKITYLDQGKKAVGTAPPLLQAQKLLKKKSFVLYYSDVLSDINLEDMIDFHTANPSVATLALTSVRDSANWGVVRVQGNKVYSFLEKPQSRKDLSHLINAGVAICNDKIFDDIHTKTKRLETEVFPELVKKKNLNGYMFAGQWYDVGNPTSYKKAVEDWQREV